MSQGSSRIFLPPLESYEAHGLLLDLIQEYLERYKGSQSLLLVE